MISNRSISVEAEDGLFTVSLTFKVDTRVHLLITNLKYSHENKHIGKDIGIKIVSIDRHSMNVSFKIYADEAKAYTEELVNFHEDVVSAVFSLGMSH